MKTHPAFGYIRGKPFTTALPGFSKPCLVRQIQQGETIRHGDWYTDNRSAWYGAESGCRLREFHLPHVRVIATGTPFYTQPL